jgi:hypothetical protein
MVEHLHECPVRLVRGQTEGKTDGLIDRQTSNLMEKTER